MKIIKNHDDKHLREELIRVLNEYDLINHGMIHDDIYWDQFDTDFLQACYKIAMSRMHSVNIP